MKVVLVGGLPASGKSSLVRSYCAMYSAVHIEYDALEDGLDLDTGLENWRQSRKDAIGRLRQFLEQNGGDHAVVILDDNYYLKSMRKEIYQTCQDYAEVRFGIVWMETHVDECVRRNPQRPRPVPEVVIQKMQLAIERPIPKYHWERAVLTLDGSLESSRHMEALHAFVTSELSVVAPPPMVDPILEQERRNAARQVTAQSRSHSADVFWRQCVSVLAQHNPKLARSANEARKRCLKNHSIGSGIASEISNDTKRAWLEQFLEGDWLVDDGEVHKLLGQLLPS